MTRTAAELGVFALVVVASIGLGILLWKLHQRRERERTEALRNLALPLGLYFDPTAQSGLWPTFEFLPICNRGHSRKVMNLLHGERQGGRVALVDYQFTTGHGKHQQTYRQTLALFQLNQLDQLDQLDQPDQGSLPDFELRPEHFSDKIASVFGGQDIDFEHNPEFSRLFRLRGSDESALRGFFHPGLLTALEREPGISLEGLRDTVMFCRLGQRVAPDQIRDFLLTAERLVGHLRARL